MIDSKLLSILVCPETRTRLQLADDDLVATLNRAAAAGWLKRRDGQAVSGPLEGGLVREDRRFLYPIRDGIPVMLVDESIALDQIGPERPASKRGSTAT